MDITHNAGAPIGSSSTAGEAQRPATRFLAPPAPPAAEPMRDHRLAAFADQLAAADEEGRELVTVALNPRHAQYLRDRAANHGESPERHLETILRNFRAYYDDRRPDHHAPPPEPGMPAITRRA